MGVPGPEDDQLDGVLARALDIVPPSIVLFDAARRPVWANRSTANLLSGDPDADVDLVEAFAPSLELDASFDRALAEAASGTASRIDAVTMATPAGQIEREGWVGPVRAGDDPSPMTVLVLPADEERLHPLLANTYDIISVLAADGTIRYSNPAAGKLMSYEGTVLAGSSAVDLVHPDDQARALDALTSRSGIENEPTRLRLRFGDGRWHHCIVHAADLLDDPAVRGIVVTIHDITEQVDAHEGLVRSELWVRRLLAQLTDVVVVYDAEGQMKYVSPSIEKLVGTPEERHAGTEAFNTVHPDDLDAVEQTFRAILAEPDTEHRVTFRLRHEDGHYLWVEAVGVNALSDPAVEGIISTVRDITQLKQAEEMSAGLVAAAPDAMVVVDDAGTIVLANERAELLFGWSATELVGQAVEALIPESLRTRHVGHRAAYRRDPHDRMMGEGIELVAQRRDGSTVPVEVSLSTHSSHQGRLTSAAIRDITVQRETRRALEAALAGEQEVVQRLQAADELKAEFVSTVAHELKGPLSVISGFARLVERLIGAGETPPEEIATMTARIAANSDRLLEMIEQLLRFSRLEAGQAKLRPVPVGVEEVVSHTVELVQEALTGHDLERSVPDGLVMWADGDGVDNVLRNLLGNAAKFAPPGSTIWIEAEHTGDGVTVSVSDEGPGVEPEDRERIFEQFHQTGAGKAKGGSGLGLSIARRYVELHGGRIWVDERPGGGARFCFWLPDVDDG